MPAKRNDKKNKPEKKKLVAYIPGAGKGSGNRLYMTVTREEGMTDKQWEKYRAEQDDILQKKAKSGGLVRGEKMTFSQFLVLWYNEHAITNLAPKTINGYMCMLERMEGAIGHKKMAEIRPMDISRLFRQLHEPNIRQDHLFMATEKLKNLLGEKEVAQKNKDAKIKLLRNGRTNSKKVLDICIDLGITTEKWQQYFEQVNGEPLSELTIRHHYEVLSSVFSVAVRWDIIKENPVVRIQKPKVNKIERKRCLTSEEIEQLLKLLKTEHIKYGAWIYTALFTGVRLGELGGLTWDDIDFEGKTLRVRQAIQALPGIRTFVKVPKSKSGKRQIDIPDILIAVLREYKVWQYGEKQKYGESWNETGHVFTQKTGELMYPSTPTQWFQKFRAKNGLPDVPFHGLRHTYATQYLLLAGAGAIRRLQNDLGHAQPSTTEMYLHDKEMEERRKVSEMFDEMYKDAIAASK